MRLLRIFFSKKGEAAYISHLDLQRVMARGLRMSGLPVWYSQGFNPHIYMSFALPLPLMVESEAECVDVKTEAEDADFSGFVPLLNAALPRGITVTRIAEPVHGVDEIARAVYRYVYEDADDMKMILKQYGELQEAMVLRKTKRSAEEVDLKAVVPRITVGDDGDTGFEVRLPAGNKLHYSPALLSGFMQQRFGIAASGASITRVRVLTADDKDFE